MLKNLKPAVNELQTKPLRADKLKGFISENLYSFMYSYKFRNAPVDRVLYLDLMSDLLAMYIDVELKVSKRSCEYHERISSRLTLYLQTYLENSVEYIMDTILKIRFMSSTYYNIMNPVLKQIFRTAPEHPSTNLMYIRYFLIYRIWRRITKDSNVRNRISNRALSSLKLYPTSLPQYVTDHVLPKVPNNEKVSTRLLFNQQVELEKSCEAFIRYYKKSQTPKDSQDVEQSRVDDTAEVTDYTPNQLEDNFYGNKLNSSFRDNPVRNVLLNNKSNNKIIPHINKNSKNTADVVIIDLTSEDSNSKIIKRHKKKKKLLWTQRVFKGTSAIVNDRKNDNNCVNEDSSNIEDNDFESLLNACIEDDIVDVEEIHEKTLQSNADQLNSMDIEEHKTINEERSSILNENDVENVKICVDYEQNIESHSDKNCHVTNECEKLPDNLQRETKLHKFSLVNDNLEISKSAFDDSKEENLNNINDNILECEHPAELNNREDYEKGNLLNSKTDLNSINVDDMNIHLRNTVLQFNQSSETQLHEDNILTNENSSKILNVDFNDHVDGLSLLASVSQGIAHLNTQSSEGHSKTRELIKVKDYSSLRTYSENADDEVERTQLNYDNQSLSDINNFVNIYANDDIGKVALNVEISSSEDLSNHYTNSNNHHDEHHESSTLFNEFPIELTSTSVQVESTVTSDKDETNVILNGETIVLMQKSPNSNLYIINKAVENKDHNIEDEAINLSEKNSKVDKVKEENFTCEMHDVIYKNSQVYPPKTTMSYENAQDNRRSTKVKLPDNNSYLDDKKSSLNNSNINNDVTGITTGTTGRCRIKQEFNNCTNLPSHIENPSGYESEYGNQGCSPDHVDSHALRISVSNPLPEMYHPSYTPGDLYISYRQNCNPTACGLSVNHPFHSRAKSQGCSCLNCAYGIVTHCNNQYIIPTKEEATSTSKIDTNYYMPIAQKPVMQECPRQAATHENNKLELYDDQLLDKKNTNINHQTEGKVIYQPVVVNNSLPLKKRFKSMLMVDFSAPIKKENVNNVIGPSIISVANLKSRDSLDSSSTLIANICTSKTSQGDLYTKNRINNCHNYSGDKKRKKIDDTYSTDHTKELNMQMIETSKKVKEQISPKKNTNRKTRSSQRQIPKINYSYMDDEVYCSPSGATKRKRKKSSR